MRLFFHHICTNKQNMRRRTRRQAQVEVENDSNDNSVPVVLDASSANSSASTVSPSVTLSSKQNVSGSDLSDDTIPAAASQESGVKNEFSTSHYQANYTFHTITPPPSAGAPANVEYTSYQVPNARVFSLKNFLSNEECDYFLNTLQSLKFDSLANEYPVQYRNNERYRSPSIQFFVFSSHFFFLDCSPIAPT